MYHSATNTQTANSPFQLRVNKADQ